MTCSPRAWGVLDVAVLQIVVSQHAFDVANLLHGDEVTD